MNPAYQGALAVTVQRRKIRQWWSQTVRGIERSVQGRGLVESNLLDEPWSEEYAAGFDRLAFRDTHRIFLAGGEN